MAKKILGVGHCEFDSGRIAGVVADLGGEFENEPAAAAALDRLRDGGYALVLANRVIGADEQGGLNLIRKMQAAPGLCRIPVMLITALPEKMKEAVAAGARPGFGKDQLESEAAAAILRQYLDEHSPGALPH